MEKKWEELVKGYKKSKLTQTEWCKQRGIKVHQLQYYKKKFLEEQSDKKLASIFRKATISEVETNIQEKHEEIELKVNSIDIKVTINTDEQ